MHLVVDSVEDLLHIFVEEALSHLERVALELSYDENHGSKGLLHGAAGGFPRRPKAVLPSPLPLQDPERERQLDAVRLPLQAHLVLLRHPRRLRRLERPKSSEAPVDFAHLLTLRGFRVCKSAIAISIFFSGREKSEVEFVMKSPPPEQFLLLIGEAIQARAARSPQRFASRFQISAGLRSQDPCLERGIYGEIATVDCSSFVRFDCGRRRERMLRALQARSHLKEERFGEEDEGEKEKRVRFTYINVRLFPL